jgi:phosphatidylglycerol:prolipoprotein diacylglycerol transferase
MINPVIFSFHIGGFEFALRWYGVLVMTGVVVAGWFAGREVTRRGENGESIWDALIWILPPGIIGARLWYVANATLGGNPYYMQNPIQILNIPQGGLHFYGGLLFGALAMIFYLRQHKMDIWLFLDAIAPATLLGQAIARPANFINQELYGQPTILPWGIPIDAAHRIGVYQDLAKFPVETTRFHPSFAYEMLWNFLAFALIIYITRRFAAQMKPGTAFFGWLVLAGVGRFIIEFFRPDQPRVGNTWISTTQVVAVLMALAGLLMLAYRYGKLKLPLPPLPEKYQVAPASLPAGGQTSKKR